jgi:glycosyltransferase involved in cell wall biosynthesis
MSSKGQDKLRVLIVTAESIAEGHAAHTRTSATAGILRQLGHHVTIVGVDDGPYSGVSFYRRLLRYVRINRTMVRLLPDYDVVIARGHFAHLPWVLMAQRMNKPVIYEMNGYVFDAMTTYNVLMPVQPLIKICYMMQFARSARILCVTQEIAEHIRNLGGYTTVETISNGVDSTIFHPGPDDEAGDYAIFPSSLAPWHGVQTLLDAVVHPAWPKDLKLVIAGDGVQAPLVRERAARNPVIQYLGLLDQETLAAKLRAARIGLCLVEPVESRVMSEVYPLKLFEMMASGVPVVATDLPGQRDIIRDSGAGVMVPLHDPAAVAEAVRTLQLSPERKALGIAGAAAVQARYDWRFGAAALDRVLRSAVNDRSATGVRN